MTSSSAETSARKQYYDDVWSRYSALDRVSPAAFHRRRLVLDKVRQLGAALSNQSERPRVLEVGTGQGELLSEIARLLPNVSASGADVSRTALEIARSRYPSLEWLELDLESDTLARDHSSELGKFSLIVCSEVLEHLPKVELAAQNLFTLLAPGGSLVVTVPGGKMSHFDRAIGHQRHYTPRSIAELLEAAGFRLVSNQAWGFPFHSLYRSLVRVASRAAMPDSAPKQPSKLLSLGYTAMGGVLRPLFHLNLSRWGEQLVVVAKRA
jgi:SAM-dependent methyltransferase